MRSNDYKIQLKEILFKAENTVDKMYEDIKQELAKEILGDKQTIQIISEEAKIVYYTLDIKLCEKLIKKKLPLKIKLFSNIKYVGKRLMDNDIVDLTFRFNGYWEYLQCSFNINEIQTLLKMESEEK